jgi:hypothetical protein
MRTVSVRDAVTGRASAKSRLSVACVFLSESSMSQRDRIKNRHERPTDVLGRYYQS